MKVTNLKIVRGVKIWVFRPPKASGGEKEGVSRMFLENFHGFPLLGGGWRLKFCGQIFWWTSRFRLEPDAEFNHFGLGWLRVLWPSLKFPKKSCVFPSFDQGTGEDNNTKAHEQWPNNKCSMAIGGNYLETNGD